jgi:hypothetical protein
MKHILVVGVTTAASFLLFGAAAPVYAQRDQHGQEGKPAQEHQQPQARPAQQQQQRAEHQQPQARPAQQQQQRAEHQQPQAKPAQQQQQRSHQQESKGGYRVPQRSQQQAHSWEQQRGWLRQGSWQEHSSWQENRSQHWQVDHRTWEQRGGYGGYYIPEDRFGLYFGSQHWFRIHSRPTIFAGYPRFRYGGFWFMLVDPWPESWPEDWYASDDVYVDYNDGYYLCNRRDPGVGIALTVVL